MRNAIAAIAVVAGGLLAANALGVADAEAPTSTTTTTTTSPTSTTPAPTVSVDGVAMLPVAQGASAAVATGVYREAMAAALADAHSKAEFLVGKAGVTLGSVQSIVEDGGSISCTGGEESDYVEYQGQEPDFPTASVSTPVPVAAGTVERATVRKKPHKPAPKKKPAAKEATATTCLLSASVSASYLVS
jgi:hypothetical protein